VSRPVSYRPAWPDRAAIMCDGCGLLVADQILHTGWHDRVEALVGAVGAAEALTAQVAASHVIRRVQPWLTPG
jgi:hypothetical protein